LVGFTTATTLPDIGRFAMTQICQAEYENSRMCTSEEIIKTVNIPPGMPAWEPAWVQPVIVDTFLFSDDEIWAVDISGAKGRGDLSCESWWSVSIYYQGLVVTHNGVFQLLQDAFCDNYNHIACCAPAQ